MLELSDSRCLMAAQGWFELGNLAEAKSELSRLSEESQSHPDVLEMRWCLFAHEQDWEQALQVARTLVQTEPDRASGWLHQAYALRRLPEGGLHAAWDALLPAAEAFTDEPTIPYNLACYACQLGNREEAFRWLRDAFQRGNRKNVKNLALQDADLEPLWGEIRKM